eukprot:1160121-Pelagomonas_calceolata.AAC.11
MNSFDGVEGGADSKGNAGLNHRKTHGSAFKEVLVRHFAAKVRRCSSGILLPRCVVAREAFCCQGASLLVRHFAAKVRRCL